MIIRINDKSGVKANTSLFKTDDGVHNQLFPCLSVQGVQEKICFIKTFQYFDPTPRQQLAAFGHYHKIASQEEWLYMYTCIALETLKISWIEYRRSMDCCRINNFSGTPWGRNFHLLTAIPVCIRFKKGKAFAKNNCTHPSIPLIKLKIGSS